MAIVIWKTKAGEERFQARVLDPEGKWYKVPSLKTRDAAEKLEESLKQLKRGGPAAASLDAQLHTVSDLWKVYQKQNRAKVSEGWRISQDQMWRDFCEGVLGGLRIAEVMPAHVGLVLTRMRELGKSEQLQLHVYRLMRQVFGAAVEYYQMIPRSPVLPKFHRPEVLEVERAFLKPAESMHLLRFSREQGGYLARPTWLGILAALRISEIQALKEGRLDLADPGQAQMHIAEIYNSKTGKPQPHTKAGNQVWLPVVPMLREFLLEGLTGDPEAFVAPGPNGGMLSYETFLVALKRLCRQAGVRELTPHELRHSATGIYTLLGGTTKDLQQLLNHGSETSTKRYVHRSDERLRAIGQGLRTELFPGHFPGLEKNNVLPLHGGVGERG